MLTSKLLDLWIALCAAYVSVGAPALIDAAQYESEMRAKHGQVSTWSELFAEAINSNDDHVIKFTYTCALEISLHPNILYQLVVMEMLEAYTVSAS